MSAEDRQHIGIFVDGLSLTQCMLLGKTLQPFVRTLDITLVSVIPPLPPRVYQLPEVVKQERARIHQARSMFNAIEVLLPFTVDSLLLQETLPNAVRDCHQRGMKQLWVAQSRLSELPRGAVSLRSVEVVLASLSLTIPETSLQKRVPDPVYQTHWFASTSLVREQSSVQEAASVLQRWT